MATFFRDELLFSGAAGESHNFFPLVWGEGHNFFQRFLGEGHNFFLSFYTLLQRELVFTSYLFCPFRKRKNIQKAETKRSI